MATIEKVLEQAGGALRKAPPAEDGSSKEAVRRWFAEFLDAHAARAELGLRLAGEQVQAGLRFLEIVRDGSYDVIVGNPPYHSTGKLANSAEFVAVAAEARADVFAAFFVRGLALLRPGGKLGYVSLSNWMYLSAFEKLRRRLGDEGIALIADFGKGAFPSGSQLISTSACLVSPGRSGKSIALRLHDGKGNGGAEASDLICAGLLAQVGRYEFDVAKLTGIEGTPLVYWWDGGFLNRYCQAPKLGDVAPVRKGLCTSNDGRFLRRPFEIRPQPGSWEPAINGAEGRAWFEPVLQDIRWKHAGLEVKVFQEYLHGSVSKHVRSPQYYFRPGLAFSMVGSAFSSRIHWRPSVFLDKGSSVFPGARLNQVVCSMNTTFSKRVMEGLNPSISFQVGDVNRLPVLDIERCDEIVAQLQSSFLQHESLREPSVEFKAQASCSWGYTQRWAQRAVDRSKGDLPPYEPEYDVPDPIAYVSFAIGVSLGRFGANGEGILTEAPATVLPAGILYLSGSETLTDSLSYVAAAPLATAWAEHADEMLSGTRQDLCDWLRKDFFAYHKKLYENRPIYFPLSSTQRSFVAFISIHRWTDNTLQTLLADHLHPNLRQLDESIADLNQARASSDRKTASGADRQYTQVKKLREELADFIAKVTECAERGAPPTAATCPPARGRRPFPHGPRRRRDDQQRRPRPLLEPQWKDPKKWWKELCEAKGRKDYDWAHLAARYFPKRADEKCRVDPSLAVAHGCFWKYHPAKAYAWELRLAHEIGPEFAIDEPDAAQHRARFLAEHSEQATELQQNERDRRDRLRRRDAEAQAGTETEPRGPGLARGSTSEPPDNDVALSEVESDDLDDEQVAV